MILDIEDQLLCPEVEAEAGEAAFDDIQKCFESFQSKIRGTVIKAKQKREERRQQNLRQMTISDMFK
jgi:hypothetical protein